ncbi:MAG: hypothetical protein IJA07_01855 [Agathobacter sp.]|nr:hypothetical protein [Agathobacter sp.]
MNIRCAVCGSKRVAIETKNEGYNVKKGVFGTLLFGSVGALAGASGNKNKYYHCADCGHTMNRCTYDFEVSSTELLTKIKELNKNIELEETKEMDKDEMTDWIIKTLKSYSRIYASLFENREPLFFYKTSAQQIALKNQQMFYDTLSELKKNYIVITEYANNEEYYRLSKSDNESKEFLSKDELVESNCERYVRMLQENVEYKKSYTNTKCRTIIEEIFGTEIDFTIPYAYDAFINQLAKHTKSILIRDKNAILFMKEIDISREENKKMKADKAYIKKCILDFLNANSGDFTSSQIRTQKDILYRWLAPKVDSLCKELAREGLVEMKTEGNTIYYCKIANK